MENNTKPKNKFVNALMTIIVVISVLIAVTLMGLRIAGFHAFTVLSGSMEPKFSVGDLIYVKEIAPEEIKVGDSITFVLNEKLVVATHQVIRIDAENKHFYTQGLANDTPDAAPVHFNNLIGKAMFAIPYIGYVSDWIQHPPGLYITISALAIFVLLLFLPDMLGKKDKTVPSPVQELSGEEKKELEELERMRAELAEVKAKLAQQQTQAEDSDSECAADNNDGE